MAPCVRCVQRACMASALMASRARASVVVIRGTIHSLLSPTWTQSVSPRGYIFLRILGKALTSSIRYTGAFCNFLLAYYVIPPVIAFTITTLLALIVKKTLFWDVELCCVSESSRRAHRSDSSVTLLDNEVLPAPPAFDLSGLLKSLAILGFLDYKCSISCLFSVFSSRVLS